MQNSWVKLALLLSLLLLVVFPLAGLAPLMLLLFVALCGLVFQLLVSITIGGQPVDGE
ncbi:hypothetical protein IQ241_13175 [Romeria aff. gracilis LEGE 07310]|uniref:Uncharacterized protein n=1 Tax=Vasconcelosia minhoensis LEGE 07310 TaxID=915328 RepID=A0A8J7DBV6_9CYAN|nr:hypothetical protein [Romeria gracilis]MBE9078232.1 hypothetical protein [Romeria aff. gracilis LEGE 07310]